MDLEPRKVKQFLSSLYYDNEQPGYFRKRGFELLAKLAYMGLIGPEGVIEKLKDVSVSDDRFLIISAVRQSYRFYKFFDAEFATWLEDMSFHQDYEIRSEAFYARGRVSFCRALTDAHYPTFLQELNRTIELCSHSESELENRVDASLLKNISVALRGIFIDDSKIEIDSYITQAQVKLWQYISFSGGRDEVAYFVNITEGLSAIRRIYGTNPQSWLDVRAELIELLVHLEELEICLVSSSLWQNTLTTDQLRGLEQNVIRNMLVGKLRYDVHRLKSVEREGLVQSNRRKELLSKIIHFLLAADNSGEEAEQLKFKLLSDYHKVFPEGDLSVLNGMLDEIDAGDPLAVSRMYVQLISEQSGANIRIETGTPTGDEMLISLLAEIRILLPSYGTEKLREASLVLRDVINYMINAWRGGKDEFEFLFDPITKEAALQKSMMIYFKASDRSGRYTPEVKDFADGGRVDIVYRSDSLELPIELKRSLTELSWETVLQNYIAQAQTYANSRDQLAVFAVLDISPNAATRPESDIRNLVKILHLQGRQNVPSNFPDYVVAFIVPGNKMLPSERSKY